MKTAIVILSVIAVASASTAAFYSAPLAPIATAAGPTAFYRSPALDSSYVESSRLGGNFAYRTVSGHAYQTVTPLAYSAYPAYTYPAYQYLQVPFAGAAPFYPYQPAFFEQPAGLKPIDSIPAAAEPAKETEGRQIDDDTVAVESA